MASHPVIPSAEWADDGSGKCAICGGRLIEAIYGGWMHSNEEPHAFSPHVYGDGTEQVGGGCTECARLADAPVHV